MEEKSKITKVIGALWASRDELSLRNVRKSYIPYILIFPLAIMLADFFYHDWGGTLLGIDNILMQMIAYGVAWLIVAVLPKQSIPVILRIAVCFEVLLVIPTVLLAEHGQIGLILITAFQFFAGILEACGFYIISYVCRNAERWTSIVIAGIYYGFGYGLHEIEAVEHFLFTVAPIISVIILAVSAFFIKSALLKEATAGDAHHEAALSAVHGQSAVKVKSPSDGNGYYFVIILFFIYYLVVLTNYFFEDDQSFINDYFYGGGMLIGVVVVTVVQLVFNKSVWHLWNVYLVLTFIGAFIIVFKIILTLEAGALIYGIANNIGYIAINYLLASVVKMNGDYKFFRIICAFFFFHDTILSEVFDRIFYAANTPAGTLGIVIILASVCICFLLSPILEKKIFAQDWMDRLHELDVEKYEEEIQIVEDIINEEKVHLTKREQEIMTLLLTNKPPKEIAAELYVSRATVDFHTNNLYRKMNIQSRTELILAARGAEKA
jgi:DNA-binding CsgD family transcriptional regulator